MSHETQLLTWIWEGKLVMTKFGLIQMRGINVFLHIFGLPDYLFPWRKATDPCQLHGGQCLKVTLT